MSRALAAVCPPWLTRYLSSGFRLVFYPTRTKGPTGTAAVGWTSRSDVAEDYHDGDNVGVFTGHEITPGRFLVDVDFDWTDGVPLARRILPPAGFGFGRASRHISHAFYTTSAPQALKVFKDVTGESIVELRGTKADGTVGLQTMLPPSIHPSGEVVTLRHEGEITHDDSVPARVLLYAVAGILFKHLGPRGFGHDVRLSVAGFLLKLGMSEADVVLIGEALAEGTGNSVSDAATAVHSTVARIKSGERVQGRTALAAAIGESGKAVCARIEEWATGGADQLSAAIQRLNERFAVVTVGNSVVVMETWPDGGIKALWKFEEFKRLLIKERLDVKGKVVELAPVWLAHPDGRRYDRLVYALPGGTERIGPEDYNGWLGFTVAPAPGDWTKNREHLRRIICGGVERYYAWLFNWMAALVQWPGRHAFTAVILRGGQGVGKGHFVHLMLGALFHQQQYVHIIGAGMLTGRFNEHLSGKVLVFADESTWGGDPAAADKLKGMVTESTIPIERKFMPLVEEPSMLHIVAASNNDWPISIAMDDRRFFVLDVADAERQNDGYFVPLRRELDDGGRAAMLHDLLAHDIDEHALRHPPSTKGKREVMAQSLRPIERWWHEKLLTGVMLGPRPGAQDDDAEWPEMVDKAALHDDYLMFLDRHRDTRTRRSTQTELGMFLAKFTPMRSERRLPGVGSRGRAYAWDLPSLVECRTFWASACGWPEDYDWDAEG